MEKKRKNIAFNRKLTISSMISLMAETDRMKMRGTKVVYLPVGETSGICCSKAIIRKKMLAHRRNCSKRNNGTNLITLKETPQKSANGKTNVSLMVPIFGGGNSVVAELNQRGIIPTNGDHSMFLPFQGVSTCFRFAINSRWRSPIFFVCNKTFSS